MNDEICTEGSAKTALDGDDGSCLLDNQELAISSLNGKNVNQPCREKDIYDALAQHQVTETWDLRELLGEMHRWAGIFNIEFDLGVPAYSLCVDWLRNRRLGHFRPGHNAFGLEAEIAINRRHLGHREFWQVLGTLLHELLHAWQEVHGKPGKHNYHNKEFQNKALHYGLIIDDRGHTQYESVSLFIELLKKHGIHVPAIPEPVLVVRGTSKSKLWFCGCTRARVAVATFRAQCLNCGREFICLD